MKLVSLLLLWLCAISGIQAQCGIITSLCYGNEDLAGENLITICPDNENETLELFIQTLELHSNDALRLYEGEDDTGTLLAEFAGSGGLTTFLDQSISSTTLGACITLDFFSNSFVSCGDGETNLGTTIEINPLVYQINCACPEPIANFQMDQNELCSNGNTTVTFDGSSSSSMIGGQIVEYLWDFGDGTTGTGEVVTHTYSNEPSLFYIPTLTVIDDNVCMSAPVTDVVIISGPPETTLVSGPSIVCPEESFNLVYVSSGETSSFGSLITEEFVPITASNIVEEIEIDIDLGNEVLDCYEDMSFTLDLAHSWVGDIGINLFCPDGTMITILKPNVDVDGNPVQQQILNEPQDLIGTYTFVNPASGVSTLQEIMDQNFQINVPIPPGTYAADQSFNNFLGCPINGTWILEIIDYWPCQSFFDEVPCSAPDLFPITLNSWSFDFGTCDTYITVNQDGPISWELDGTPVGTPSGTTTSITAPATTGLYDYVAVYTDEFGCVYYPDTVTIEVLGEPDCNLPTTESIQLDMKVFLEGPYDETSNEMSVSLEGIMPTEQPYSVDPYFYEGNESINIPTADIVDWLLIELRTGTPDVSEPNTTVVDTKAALLLSDGQIVEASNGELLSFEMMTDTDYYIAIHHRNHLDILSANFINTGMATNQVIAYDFTNEVTKAFGPIQLAELSTGVYGMFAGDFLSDGIIQVTDYDLWKINPAIVNTYANTDGNLDGLVQTTDYDDWVPNKAKIGVAEVSY